MSDDERVRAVLERARRRARPPAMGAALVAPTGAVSTVVVGARARGGPDDVSPQDRWHIGSCTKAVTASGYALLVQGGAAVWGAALPDLFPDLRAHTHAAWGRVTIDDVLRHRAGLPANLTPAALRSAAADPRAVTEQRTAVVARALATPPRSPGSFGYSNLGYIVAGAAIERLAGRPWEDATRDLLLAPLGITSAGFGAPVGTGPWGHAPRRRGVGRGPGVDPMRTDRPEIPTDNPPVMGPAGRLHLELADWGRFVAQFLAGGATVLRPESIARMLTVPDGGTRQGMGWAFPRSARRRGGGGRIAFGQQGSNRLWVATALVSPGRDRAALVVANDGRTRMLRVTAAVASDLLRGS